MPVLLVDLNIPADEYQKYYQQQGTLVHCQARDGRTVQFPATILHRYISHSGVQGAFKIQFSDEGKFESIEKLN